VGTAGLWSLFAEPASACTICFAGVDSPLLDAARIGVLTMAAITISVLAAFSVWFVRLARLERDRESAIEDPPSI
jgi:hypothetical protein